MKALLLVAIASISLSAKAQYYYKDIIGTMESSEMMRNYIKSRVHRVLVTSFNGDNQKDSAFYVEQEYAPDTRSLRTVTRSGMTSESLLTSFVDEKGNVTLTVDSSDIVVSRTEYRYNSSGQLQSLTSRVVDSSGRSNETEEHIWYWGSNGKPLRMLRIKNRKDTIQVNLKYDENGNVNEETEIRRGVVSQPVYYYYNEAGQLTDIVRFSKKAGRLLPEYMFEYTEGGRLKQKITLPANSSEYMIWVYQYNDQGLKTREAIFTKHDKRKAVGKIVYEYSFH